MSRSFFLHIQSKVEAYETYFIQKRDNSQRLGLSLLQKMTVIVRMLAYGVTTELWMNMCGLEKHCNGEFEKIYCNCG